MKLSELIKHAQELMDKEGDLDVAVQPPARPWQFSPRKLFKQEKNNEKRCIII